ncbi:hypothetical protein HRbin16_02957 [bacterium HR16]|nr:hypothetical protein HRbin16_02957 [bacterium HR16]
MAFNGFHANLLQVVHRRTKSDAVGDVGRSGFELGGDVRPGAVLMRHTTDHATPAHERRHLFQQLTPGVQRADTGRREHLVAGEGVEIAIYPGNVHRLVRNRLCAVDQYLRTDRVRLASDLFNGVDRAQHVGDVCDGYQLRLLLQRPLQRVHIQLAFRSKGYIA